MKRLLVFLFALTPVLSLQAETGKTYDFPTFTWYVGTLLLAAVVIGWAFYAMFRISRYLDQELSIARQKLDGTWVEPEPQPVALPQTEPVAEEQHSLFDRLQNAVPVQEEASITLDHNYDGIRELDNDLPPWWTALFYITAGFAVFYMLNYHILKTGDLPREKYDKSVLLAEALRQERLAASGDEINASTVTTLTDASSLTAGKEIFLKNCMTCHGADGQGLAGAGPNFTDEYWIHGGAIGDLYTTIRYGVPAKGMISWKDQLPPKQIQQVASYILSLQGTNPPNALPPQGERYIPEDVPAAPGTPEAESPADGVPAPADTTATAAE